MDFEIMKCQVTARGELAASPNRKTIVMPTNVTAVLGSLQTLLDGVERKGGWAVDLWRSTAPMLDGS